MAATSTICHLLTSGDHIICGNDVYVGTDKYFNKIASRSGIRTTFVDLSNCKEITNAIESSTKLVWIESPTNPKVKLVDIKQVVEIVKNRNDKILIAVDNTF